MSNETDIPQNNTGNDNRSKHHNGNDNRPKEQQKSEKLMSMMEDFLRIEEKGRNLKVTAAQLHQKESRLNAETAEYSSQLERYQKDKKQLLEELKEMVIKPLARN